MDDAIDSGDYKIIKAESERKLLGLEAKLTGFSKREYNLDDCIDNAIRTLSRLPALYNESDTTVKRSIIG